MKSRALIWYSDVRVLFLLLVTFFSTANEKNVFLFTFSLEKNGERKITFLCTGFKNEFILRRRENESRNKTEPQRNDDDDDGMSKRIVVISINFYWRNVDTHVHNVFKKNQRK